jgi:uncharacterized protein YukE
MAMGNTSRVVLNDEMQTAKTVCAEYRTKIASLVSTLGETVEGLLAQDFTGEAATGFKNFYTNNVAKFFEAGSTFDSYLAMYDKEGEGLFDSIEKALVVGEGVDPALGENNNSIGQPADSGQTTN